MNESATYEIKFKTFTSPLDSLERKMDAFESKIGGIGKSMGKMAVGLGVAFGASEVLSGIVNMGKKIVGLGAEMEQTRVSFETMLGSSEKATQVLANLTKFAEATPFRQDEVIQGAKQMLAFGFQAENLTGNLRMLGDVSAGLSIPIGDMIYLFGTLKTQGKAMTKDIMQFAQRGIPIYDELAKVLGVSKDKVAGFIEDGKVSFEVVEKAFANMTSQGSMFGGLMDKQSKTLAGRWSTFQDKLEGMGRVLGEKLLPTLGKVLDWITKIVEVIPRLDFSPITQTFSMLWDQVSELFGVFTDLFGLFGSSISTFDILSGAIKYLGFLLRAAWTPVRFLIQGWTQFLNLIKGSLPIFSDLKEIISSVFTGNFSKAGKAFDSLKGNFSKLGSTMATSWSDFKENESEGWAKIFSSSKDKGSEAETTNSSFAKGVGKVGGATAGTGKSSTAGVEKIQAGTRNVSITINKLIETVMFDKTGGQSEAQLIDMIKRTLLTAVNDVNIVAQ